VFGQPHNVEYSEDELQSLWTYYKVEASLNAWSYVPYIGLLAGGTNMDTTKAYFFFDVDGRLIRVQTNKTSDSENEWVGLARAISRTNRDTQAVRVEQEMRKLGKPFDKKLAKSVATVR
jgi:hypothetical protein